MLALLDTLSGLEKFFATCAIIGGILFVFRLVMQFTGADADTDGDVGDIDVDSDIQGGDTDISFRVLSFQGLTAFFMMFGLVGFALMHQSGWKAPWSILGATGAGFGTCWLMKLLFEKAGKLQSSGNINLQNAIGQEGTVYLNIPATGTGKARVTVQDHLKIFDAVSQGEVELNTGVPIKVVSIVSNNILVVEKLPDKPKK